MTTPPCVLFADDHLLVVHKPAGVNTHAPSALANPGIYELLRESAPEFASLAIIHRLDKETSGLLLFTRTPAANKSLTQQFTDRRIKKRYVLQTDRSVSADTFRVQTHIARAGEKYVALPGGQTGEPAETLFRVIHRGPGRTLLEAEPITGRTHQIRVHAAHKGFPILGDTLYGGSTFARLCLHATSLEFLHPAEGQKRVFESPFDFESHPALEMRRWMISSDSDAYRLFHGAADGLPGIYADRLGDYLLVQTAREMGAPEKCRFEQCLREMNLKGVYLKRLQRQMGRTSPESSSPEPWLGEKAPPTFCIKENGVGLEVSFEEGYSVGVFLDQRQNRARLLHGWVGSQFPGLGERPLSVLNTFSYTCAFSVCAALAGHRVTSLDLSKKYLEWGRRNFQANGLDPSPHDFIFGDTFDWAKRLHKKGRKFDLVLTDPPSFSRSKESGVFQAEKDYGKLVEALTPLILPNGVLFASTNLSTLPPEKWLQQARDALRRQGRRVVSEYYASQPNDFPIHPEEPGYLKTAWFKLA